MTKHDLLCIVLMWAPVLLGAIAAAFGATSSQYLSVSGVGAIIACWIYFAYVARPREQWLSRMNAVTGALWTALDQPARSAIDSEAEPIQLTQSLQEAANAISIRATRATAATSNLRSVFDASHSVSIATDGVGSIVLANDAASKFFARSSFDRLSIENIFTHAGVLDQHSQALQGKTIVSQVRFATQEGPRIYQVLTAPLPLVLVSESLAKRSVSGAIVTLRDVTELALAIQLKTDFVANASHELRTPLASIRGAIETLSDGGWEEESLRTRLSTMISNNVERLEELVRDLLDLSRLESPDAPIEREPISLMLLTDSVVGTFADACSRRRLKIEVQVQPLANSITSDRKLLTLILRNLIENATKFAYEGTTIRVIATRHEEDVRIDVVDQGVGIPLAQQTRIFERFYQVESSRTGTSQPTTNNTNRGTGLGLSIVKHAVKTLGGTISVDSVWGEGTTMRVEIQQG